MPFDLKIVGVKSLRGALLCGALLFVYDPNVLGIANWLPEQYRTQATVLLAAALPALRNTLKYRLSITLGGLL